MKLFGSTLRNGKRDHRDAMEGEKEWRKGKGRGKGTVNPKGIQNQTESESGRSLRTGGKFLSVKPLEELCYRLGRENRGTRKERE